MIEVQVFTLDTGRLFSETHNLIERTELHLGSGLGSLPRIPLKLNRWLATMALISSGKAWN